MAIVLSEKTIPQVPLSVEEDDQLHRSSKKIKNADFHRVPEGREEWPALGKKYSGFVQGGPSFAEKLTGTQQQAGKGTSEEPMEDDHLSDEEMSEEDDQMTNANQEEFPFKSTEVQNRNFPVFSFSGKLKKRLYRAWRRTVIVKLMDRAIGYKALHTRLQAWWARKGVINLIDIGHGYFMVKMTNKDDYFMALTEGPWMVYDTYLSVRPWEPNFRPETAIIDKVAAWVRIPRLPLEYYDEEALTYIGNRIGKTLRVDMNTSHQLRGHYARICVLIDLGKQLMQGFTLEGQDHYLEYEGLHMLCVNCGNYGHKFELCPAKVGEKEAGEKEAGETMDKGEGNSHAKQESEGARKQEQWRTVHKTRKQRRTKDARGESTRQENSGSRFNVLARDEPREDQTGEGGQLGLGRVSVQEQPRTQRSNAARAPRENKKTANNIEKNKEADMGEGSGMVAEVSGVHKEQRKIEKRSRELMRKDLFSSQPLMLTQGGTNETTTRGEKKGDQLMTVDREISKKEDFRGEPELHRRSIILMGKWGHGEMAMEVLDPGDNGPSLTKPEEDMEALMEKSECDVVPETQSPLDQ